LFQIRRGFYFTTYSKRGNTKKNGDTGLDRKEGKKLLNLKMKEVRKNWLIVFLFFASSFNGLSQPGDITVINCNKLNPGLNDNYNFNFIKQPLANKKYVFLGENEHGDGETLLLKTKLIKYLHDSLGFDVLLLEYGLYETAEAWNNLSLKKDSATGILSYLKYFTGDIIGLDDIYLGRYLEDQFNKSTPLQIGGIDINWASIYQNNFPIDLRKILANHHFDFTNAINRAYYDDFCAMYNRTVKTYNVLNLKNLFDGVDLKRAQIAGNHLINFIQNDCKDEKACRWITQCIKSELAFYKSSSLRLAGAQLSKYQDYNFRDSMMGENLNVLIKYIFPGKKIIISTSTVHMTKQTEQLWYDSIFFNYKSMMRHVDKQILDSSYCLPFIRYEGSTGKPGFVNFNYVRQIRPGNSNSIEFRLSQDCEYCFIDYSSNAASRSYIEGLGMSPIRDDILKANWFSIYNGIFFVRKMSPVKIFLMADRIYRNKGG
jgi:erythromycin esterase